MRKAFSMSVWYLLRNIEMVKDIDVLWNVVSVICMGNVGANTIIMEITQRETE